MRILRSESRPNLARLIWPAAALALSGCGLAQVEEAQDAAADVGSAIADLRPAPSGYAKLRVSGRPFLGLRPSATPRSRALPERLAGPDGVTIPLRGTLDDAIVAARITAATDLHVRLSGAPPTASAEVSLAGALADGWSPVGGIWTGPLDALLDAWTVPAGYSWAYDAAASEVVVTRRRSVTWRINALLGTQSYSAQTNTAEAGSGEGASSQSGQTLTTQANYDPWPEIRAQLGALTSSDATVVVSPTAALVTVTARPSEVAAAKRWLDRLNRDVLRPVTVSAHVYTVRTARAADYRLGIVAALERILGGRASGLQLEIGSTAGSIAVVKPVEGAALTADTFAGTLAALQSIGTTSRVLSADVPSLNGRPAQFFELLKQAYLAQVSTETTETGTRTTLTPGLIASGFSMSYVARIVAPDEILVRLFASLRDRPTFAVFGTGAGGDQIQLPTYADRAVQVTQRLRRGETMIVSGFRDRSSSADLEGTLDPHLPFPDGARRGASIRLEQILLLRAEVGEPLGITAAAPAGDVSVTP